MTKKNQDKQLRIIDGKIHRCSIDADDILSEARSCLQEIDQEAQSRHIRQVHDLRCRATELRSRVFLIVEDKRRLMDAQLEQVRNKAMKPKRQMQIGGDMTNADEAYRIKLMRSRSR